MSYWVTANNTWTTAWPIFASSTPKPVKQVPYCKICYQIANPNYTTKHAPLCEHCYKKIDNDLDEDERDANIRNANSVDMNTLKIMGMSKPMN
jgi:hypothetical protein